MCSWELAPSPLKNHLTRRTHTWYRSPRGREIFTEKYCHFCRRYDFSRSSYSHQWLLTRNSWMKDEQWTVNNEQPQSLVNQDIWYSRFNVWPYHLWRRSKDHMTQWWWPVSQCYVVSRGIENSRWTSCSWWQSRDEDICRSWSRSCPQTSKNSVHKNPDHQAWCLSRSKLWGIYSLSGV